MPENIQCEKVLVSGILITMKAKMESAGLRCAECGAVIPDQVVYQYATREARRKADPTKFRQSPGRPRTVLHDEANPKCTCMECRVERRARAQERRRQAGR
jgi:hypothetical protein